MVKKSKTYQRQADHEKSGRAEQKKLRNVMFPETLVAGDLPGETVKRLVADEYPFAISTHVLMHQETSLPEQIGQSFPADLYFLFK
jgi:hypothetical protein